MLTPSYPMGNDLQLHPGFDGATNEDYGDADGLGVDGDLRAGGGFTFDVGIFSQFESNTNLRYPFCCCRLAMFYSFLRHPPARPAGAHYLSLISMNKRIFISAAVAAFVAWPTYQVAALFGLWQPWRRPRGMS